jgi:HEAT repeats
MSPQDQNKVCAQIAPLLVFYVCDEVSEQECTSIDEHLALCSDCQAQLKDEREFHTALTSLPRSGEQLDSTGILLSQCRSELAETLDDLDHPPVKEKTSHFAFLRRWMALHPAWSAATLVLLGLVAGSESTQWLNGQRNTMATDQAVNIRPGPRFTEDQLSKMVVAGVNLTPSPEPGSKNVRVLLSAEQPVELTGNLDDSDVRNVLTYVVKNGERFDSGVRLDCLDALRARSEDSEVRSALLCAARRDQNPAVRLKALEALRGSASDASVREVLLQALEHDANPGVRVEAVNLLVHSLESGQQDMGRTPGALPELSMAPMVQATGASAVPDGSLENVIRTLGDLQHNDPSRYVRLRSAAALREISARNEQ